MKMVMFPGKYLKMLNRCRSSTVKRMRYTRISSTEGYIKRLFVFVQSRGKKDYTAKKSLEGNVNYLSVTFGADVETEYVLNK